MRKLYALLLSVISVFTLMGCSTSSDHEYYHESYLIPYRYDAEEAEQLGISVDGAREPSDEQKEIFAEVFSKVTEFYGLEKEEPKLKVLDALDENVDDAYETYGFYDGDGTIYIVPDFSRKNIPVLAHELMHYFTDGETNGLVYFTEDKELIFGWALNEGIANYLSTQVYPFKKGESIYEFETHVAELLALLMGEEELREAYFSLDYNKIRDVVTENIKQSYGNEKFTGYNLKEKLDCFEVFLVSLDSYSRYLGAVETVEGSDEYAIDMAESVEETMLTALENVGKSAEAKKIVKGLFENEKHIPWKEWTNFPKMIK